MNLRVAHNGEDQEMDVVDDGAPVWHPARPKIVLSEAGMTASLLRAIERDPNPQGQWKGAIPSEDGTSLLIDTADGRTFVLTVREA